MSILAAEERSGNGFPSHFPPCTLQTRQSPLIMTLPGFRGVANGIVIIIISLI